MPTIIDSLIIKVGYDVSGMEAQERATKRAVQGLGSEAKNTESSFKDLTRSVGAFLAALGGVYALKAFAEDLITSNAALERLSRNLGVSVENISAWGNAVEEVGGSAKGLQGTLSHLSAAQTEFQLTGNSSLVPYFAALGVAMSDAAGKARPVTDMLLDLSDRFSKLDRPTANNLGKMIGIDQDTLNVLLQGRHEVELTIKRQKEYNAVSKAQAEEAVKLQRSIVELKQSFNAFGRDLLYQAAPALEKVLDMLSKFAGWVKNNREFLTDLAVALGAIALGFTTITIAVNPITRTIAVITALGTAIALLWQDYQVWKRGGDALIDWEKWKPGIDAAIAGVKELAKVVRESFGAIGEDLEALNALKNGDWKGALAHMRKSDDHVRSALSTGLHAGLGVATGIANSGGQPGSVSDSYAMKYFMDRGFGRNQAAGLASNIHSESGGRVNAVGDGGAAYGILQFHKDRQDNFKKFTGHDIRNSTADEQLSFMVHELMSTERGAGNALRGATSASQAGEIASRAYVRPGDVLGEAQRRGAYAQHLAGGDNSVSVQTGPITINTQATDAAGIADSLSKSFSYAFTAQANSGLQ